MAEKIVTLYYSSLAQPAFRDRHRDCIEFCNDHGITVRTVDIAENPEQAKEDGVIATPTVVTACGDHVEKHVGIPAGYKEIIRDAFNL
ncbi:hypothetical protein [Natrinema sp. 1APR25-10V2]|uniref:hypothetical protein n=1 Tax=Natrinema sp. 1APR25-10V2 TaxID=2951081 RepID=UPI002876E7EA|nr:hypothetical protein [Natrinema sp. 1APR25-10V2]MDS0476844.1 circadian clock KaiB family protein [Natrinema sp. 1APR25-10V2]